MCRYVCVSWVCLSLEWKASESTVVMKLCECVGDLMTELVYGMVWNSYFTWESLYLPMRLLQTQVTQNSTDTNITRNTKHSHISLYCKSVCQGSVDGRGCHFFSTAFRGDPCHPISFDHQL